MFAYAAMDRDWIVELAATLAVAVLLTFSGWIANIWVSRREKRREVRVEILLSAYRCLDAHSNRPKLTPEEGRRFKSAITDVLLAGSARQIELAEEFSRSFADGAGATLSPLLEALRQDLRKELQLGTARPRSVWLSVETEPDGAAQRP